MRNVGAPAAAGFDEPPPVLEPASSAPAAVRWIGAGLVGAVAVFAGWLLWQARMPAFQYMVDVFAMAGLVLVAGASWLAWFVVGVLLGAVRRRWVWYRQPWRWTLWAGVGVVLALILTQVPLRVNVLLSQSALESRVTAAQNGSSRPGPARIGGFAVEEVRLTDESCRGSGCEVVFGFELNSSGPSALVYSPQGAPRHQLSGVNGHLFGPWYWAADD